MRAAVALSKREALPETLGEAYGTWLAQVDCAEVTRLAHTDNARYLLRFFGNRHLSDFAGKPGGEIVADYLRSEMGGRDRGLREKFGGTGNLSHHLTYNTARTRVNSLRHVLEHALKRGLLKSMPEPWPIPPRGSHGQVARARFLLKPEREAAIARESKRRRTPLVTSTCGTPPGEGSPGGATLGRALDWLMKFGVRRITKATITMHAEHVRRLRAFYGPDRPLADFRGCSGYRLAMEFVEKEGPDEGGRGIKFVTVRKYLNTLAMTLREATKRGDLDAMPPWPELPNDSQPRERLPQRLTAVVGVVDGEVLLQPDQRSVLPQQPGAETMERANPNGRIAGEPLDAAAHLVSGFIREGQSKNLLAGNALFQQPGDTMRHHARLAAARSRQDQQGAFKVCNRFPLRVGESIQ